MSIKLVQAVHVDGQHVGGYDSDTPAELFKRLQYLEQEDFNLDNWQFSLEDRFGNVLVTDWNEQAHYEYQCFLASQVKKKTKTRKK